MFFQSVISNRTSMSLQIRSSKTISSFPFIWTGDLFWRILQVLTRKKMKTIVSFET